MRKTFLFFNFKMNFGISKVHHNFFEIFYYMINGGVSTTF